MAHIPRLELAARHHAAVTPGFLPSVYVATVQLNGGLTSFIINSGHNIYTPRGEEAANFIHALYTFCLERCALGLGDVPYIPLPIDGAPILPAPNQQNAGDGHQEAAHPPLAPNMGAVPPNNVEPDAGNAPFNIPNVDGEADIPEDLLFLFDDIADEVAPNPDINAEAGDVIILD
jgi:hypothetical protein